MRLFATDKSFKKDGVCLPGIPFLADTEAELVLPANRYLFYIAAVRGRTRAPTTWQAYADHLYEYFSFLEENELKWNEIRQEQVAVWRNFMLDRGLKRSTINKRLLTVSAFYTWCVRNNLAQQLPFDTHEVYVSRPKGFFAHLDVSGNRVQANDLTLRVHKPSPKFLVMSDAVHFIEALPLRRTQLMAYLMLLCGLRRDEVCGLDIRVLPSPAGHASGKAIKMVLDPDLTPTKGSKLRWVLVPYQLLGHLHDYLMRERPRLANLFAKRHGRESTKLFLSRQGEELSRDGLDIAFQRGSARSGVRCTPHHLRHTFGTYEFLRMCEVKGRDGALYWVRDRLGHSSVTTTEMYVHAADLLQHDGVDDYVDEVLQKLGARP